MSLITYNGVSLPYSETTRFNQRAVRDESDTDWYLTEFDIETTTLVNANYLGLLAPDINVTGGTRNTADIMNVIRTRLLTHRKKLSFTFNNVELIPQPIQGNAGTCDAANGPKPQRCQIIQLTDATFIISFHIIAHYWESSNSSSLSVRPTDTPVVVNLQGNNVLYNRWSETTEFDQEQYCNRIREGKFVIRSDNQDGLVAAQVLRQMAIVGVPQGFLRLQSSYTVDPNGLAIMYRVSDKEQYRMPPSPAFSAKGWYTETLSRRGAVRMIEARVILRGSKITPQAGTGGLIKRAFGVAASKLNKRLAQLRSIPQAPGNNFCAIIDSATLRQGLYENEVECIIRWMVTVSNEQVTGNSEGVLRGAIQGFTNITDDIGSGVLDNPNYTPNYLDRGTASRLLQAASYYDPTVRNVVFGRGQAELTGGMEPGQAGKNLET